MRAKNPPRSVTARRCIGLISRHRQSRCGEVQIEAVMKNFRVVLLVSSLALLTSGQTQAESLEKLAEDFWAWRAKHAPFTGDDVNRIERPGGIRDWSRASIDNQQKDLAEFEARLKKLDATGWPIPKR